MSFFALFDQYCSDWSILDLPRSQLAVSKLTQENMVGRKIEIEIEPDQPYREVKRSEIPNVVSSPQKLRRNFKENRITPAYLREHCRRNDLYMIPRFNTVLYLHFKANMEFQKIFNIHKYF